MKIGDIYSYGPCFLEVLNQNTVKFSNLTTGEVRHLSPYAFRKSYGWKLVERIAIVDEPLIAPPITNKPKRGRKKGKNGV
jgi:hypothetical protein